MDSVALDHVVTFGVAIKDWLLPILRDLILILAGIYGIIWGQKAIQAKDAQIQHLERLQSAPLARDLEDVTRTVNSLSEQNRTYREENERLEERTKGAFFKGRLLGISEGTLEGVGAILDLWRWETARATLSGQQFEPEKFRETLDLLLTAAATASDGNEPKLEHRDRILRVMASIQKKAAERAGN